jgi:hypothetical protein
MVADRPIADAPALAVRGSFTRIAVGRTEGCSRPGAGAASLPSSAPNGSICGRWVDNVRVQAEVADAPRPATSCQVPFLACEMM